MSEPVYWLLLTGILFVLVLPVQRLFSPKPTQATLEKGGADVRSAAEPRSTVASPGIQLGAGTSFDPEAQQLTVGAETTALTFREAKLLNYLADHRNTVLERQKIHDAVWGEEGVIVGRSLDVFISRLRKKLAGIEGVEIQTVHGVGYRFHLSA